MMQIIMLSERCGFIERLFAVHHFSCFIIIISVYLFFN